MVSEPITKNDRGQLSDQAVTKDDRALRELAIKQVERVRSFRLHLVAYVVGIFLLGGVWVLTEYFEEHSWPDRFADAPDVAGTWSPWFFWAVGIWTLILGIHALKTFAHRPPSEAEIERELERLTSRL
ncbi:MAG: 2TM domain-containing protein [Gaiellales bacterium]